MCVVSRVHAVLPYAVNKIMRNFSARNEYVDTHNIHTRGHPHACGWDLRWSAEDIYHTFSYEMIPLGFRLRIFCQIKPNSFRIRVVRSIFRRNRRNQISHRSLFSFCPKRWNIYINYCDCLSLRVTRNNFTVAVYSSHAAMCTFGHCVFSCFVCGKWMDEQAQTHSRISIW